MHYEPCLIETHKPLGRAIIIWTLQPKNVRALFFCFANVALLVSGCGHGPNPKAELDSKSVVESAPSISVAAAADLKYAFEEIVTAFRCEHPEIQVEMTYGSSGNLFTQLSNKAPFDMYFSADLGYPGKLIENGLAREGSEFSYAVGHLVVWVRNDSHLDLETEGLKVVNDPSVQKIAIANPRHAPYGRAAEAALKECENYASIKDRLVLGENVVQAAQFVESGGADVGLIAQSLAQSPALRGKGRFWTVPQDTYPVLEQGGLILSWARFPSACEQLREFVRSEPGRQIFRRFGFGIQGE